MTMDRWLVSCPTIPNPGAARAIATAKGRVVDRLGHETSRDFCITNMQHNNNKIQTRYSLAASYLLIITGFNNFYRPLLSCAVSTEDNMLTFIMFQ